MTSRRGEIAPPAMDTTERDLDRRQIGGFGKCGGGLQSRHRAGILAKPRPELPDPGVGSRGMGKTQR